MEHWISVSIFRCDYVFTWMPVKKRDNPTCEGMGRGCVFMCVRRLFTADRTLNRVKAKTRWQVSACAMINTSGAVAALTHMRLLYIGVLHTRVRAKFACVVASPCSLLLSPLCEAWPPLEGPGVPAECVEVASSWSLQEAGF